MNETQSILLGIGLIYGLSFTIMAYRAIRSNRIAMARHKRAIEAAQDQLLAEAYRILNKNVSRET